MKAVMTIAAAGVLAAALRAQGAPPPARERVTFRSGSLTLAGFVFRPAGAGPFRAIVWNHGSEKLAGTSVQFDSVAAIFVPAGYVVFAPMRRGHGLSEGDYIVDVTTRTREAHGADSATRLAVRLLETEQLDDQLAGLTYVKSLPYVDTTRIVVAGCSYGGIQTLLAAERGPGYKAAFSISPAALSWRGNPYLRARLLKAVAGIRIPVSLIQPPKDASLEPERVLGAEFRRLGKVFTSRVYPAEGPEELQGHCFGGARGMHLWGKDALSFFAKYLP